MRLDEHGRWSDSADEFGHYSGTDTTGRGRKLFSYAEFVAVIAAVDAYARSRTIALYHASTDFAARARARTLRVVARSRALTFFARLLNITLYDHEDE
jgi:hypothetical protein